MIDIPCVGSTVRVTIQRKNIYYKTYLFEPFITKEYEGTVLPKNKWNLIDTFNLTGNESIPIRNISLKDVVKIDYIKGERIKSNIRIFKVKSKRNSYTVIKNNDEYQCDCIGFKYHRNCRHVKGVAAKLNGVL